MARLQEIARHALETGKTITPAAEADDSIEPLETDLGNMIVVPLAVQDRRHGILMFVNEGPEQRELVQAETELAIVFGKAMALGLDRVQLAQVTNYAPLAAMGPQAPVEN